MSSLAIEDLQGEYAFYDERAQWMPRYERQIERRGLTPYQVGQLISNNHSAGRFRAEVAENTTVAGSVVRLRLEGVTPYAPLAIITGRLDGPPPEAFGKIVVPFEETLDALIRIPEDAEGGTYVFFGQQWEPGGNPAYPGGALIHLSALASVEVRSLTDEQASSWTPILAEEVARMRRFPGLAFRGPVKARRAWIIGTAMDVWEVIEAYKAMGIERLLQEGDLPEPKVRLALGYYEAYSDEIDRVLAENRRTEEEWHRLYPEVFAPPEQSR